MTAPMQPANGHDEAQRTLERHALLNVHALAQRLGYIDSLDRKAEKKGMKILAAAVGLLLVGLLAMSFMPSRRADEDARRRCEIDAQAREGIRAKDELMAANPGLGGKELQEKLRERSKAMAASAKAECARGPAGQ